MSIAHPTPPKEELLDMYNTPGSSISAIARHYKVHTPTVRSWFKKYEIPFKGHLATTQEWNKINNSSPIPSKEELEPYFKEFGILSSCQHFSIGQSTLFDLLDEYDINRNNIGDMVSKSKKRIWDNRVPSEEEFREAYKQVGSLNALRIHYDLSRTSIDKLVQLYGVTVINPMRSAIEHELFKYCQELRPDLIFETNDRKILNGYEIDIVCHELKLGIEYCGLYWHSEYSGGKNRNYHKMKRELAKEKGYQLLTIFESDDLDKVKSLLRVKLGKANRIFARNCEIQYVTSAIARDFHEKYHMHGSVGASVHIGLFYKNDLVMVISFGSYRFSDNFQWECTRMTSKKDTVIIGGASKLFKFFIEHNNVESLITFADLRFGDGNVYGKFLKFVENTKPNYWYFSKNRLESRTKYQKHKLNNMSGYSHDKTEWEIMLDSGFDRIWDCGNSKFSWVK
jgi:hypothetical protein